MAHVLVLIGLWSIALGAVSGFAMTLVVEKPEVLRAVGINHHRRVLQLHLDWVIMGVLMAVVGAVAAHSPMWALILVAIGGVVNPLLFVPLAISAESQRALLYRAVSAASFISLSSGLTAVAIYESIG